MTGSAQDNSIVDNSTGEEENTGVDSSSSTVDEINAADEISLDGFDDSDESDGSKETESNTGEQEDESNNSQEETKESAESEKSEETGESEESTKSGGRPDKRQRQLTELQAQLARERAENERLRAIEAQSNQPKRPVGDESGNITLDEYEEYQDQRTLSVVQRQLAEFEQRAMQAEDQRNQTEALASVKDVIGDARGKYKVLDSSDPSYDAELDAQLLDRVQDAISPYMVAGSRDYKAVVGTVEDTIKKTMEFYDKVGSSRVASTQRNMESLRDSSALASAESGRSSDPDPDIVGWD